MPQASYAIVGAKFRPPAQGILNVLRAGAKLLARREPSNAYDPNAIQVLWAARLVDLASEAADVALAGYGSSVADLMNNPDEWHLGYVPRAEALTLAPKLDERKITTLEGQLTFSATGVPRVTLEVPA